MRRPLAVALLALALSACAAFQVETQYPRGNTTARAPATRTELVASAPAGLEPFAVVTLQGSDITPAAACEARALQEAQHLGAALVVVAPEKAPGLLLGPRCEARLYDAPAPAPVTPAP